MSGNRHNGGIIGPRNAPGQAIATGIWDLQIQQQSIPETLWPITGLPQGGLLANWDLSTASSLYDATSGGALVAADGAIARVNDLSGNGNHLLQSTLNYRPIRKTAYFNGLDAALCDGSGDGWSLSSNPFTTIFIIFSYSTSDSKFVHFWGQNETFFTYAAEDGAASTSLVGNLTSASLRVDGAAFTGSTRDDLHTALSGTHVATISANFSSWTEFNLFSYLDSGFGFSGTVGQVIIYDQSFGTVGRDAAEIYLTDKWI